MSDRTMATGTRRLLVVSAVLELTAGAALLFAPAAVASVLLGAPLEAPAALFVARLAGAALLALGIGCAMARGDVRAIVGAMFAYNLAAAGLLVAGALDPQFAGARLWAAAVVHAGLAGWCIPNLGRPRSRRSARS